MKYNLVDASENNLPMFILIEARLIHYDEVPTIQIQNVAGKRSSENVKSHKL